MVEQEKSLSYLICFREKKISIPLLKMYICLYYKVKLKINRFQTTVSTHVIIKRAFLRPLEKGRSGNYNLNYLCGKFYYFYYFIKRCIKINGLVAVAIVSFMVGLKRKRQALRDKIAFLITLKKDY